MEMQAVIAAMDESAVEEFGRLLPTEEIEIIRAPRTGLLMMAVKDSFQTDFYLGEILVTEVEVEFAGKAGYAMMIGDNAQKAILAASAEAVMQFGDVALVGRISDFLAVQAGKIAAAGERARMLIALTKVDFETMVPG
jgi:phosphonate C-P lyase system protein PhnG